LRCERVQTSSETPTLVKEPGSTHQPDGRSSTAVAYKHRKCTSSHTDVDRPESCDLTTNQPHGQPAEFGALPSRPHLLASERFHALFRSLFKVLFNFPSRYLFAIVLVVLFRHRSKKPPTSPCTRKQGDSLKARIGDGCSRHGPCTLHGMEPHSGELTRASHTDRHLLHATVPATVTMRYSGTTREA